MANNLTKDCEKYTDERAIIESAFNSNGFIKCYCEIDTDKFIAELKDNIHFQNVIKEIAMKDILR